MKDDIYAANEFARDHAPLFEFIEHVHLSTETATMRKWGVRPINVNY